MRTYSYISSTSANTTKTYGGGYSHTTLRQNESNLLSNARSLRSNYGKNTAKGRQKYGKRTITRRQRIEIKSITTAHIALTSPTHTLSYPIGASPANVFRRNRFFRLRFFTRFTATLLLLITLGIGNVWADNTKHPIYCAINPSSLGETGVLYLNVHKGTTYDGDVWYLTPMTKIATTISKAATKETKDLYYAEIEYVEVGLNELQFQIYDAAPPASPRETKVAFSSWKTSSDDWTKPIFDYENGNFTTYPASLAEKTSYVYFDAADWTDAKIQLATGHGLYQGYNELSSHLDNTTIYYAHPTLNWADAVHIAFVGHATMFETKANWLTDMPYWADHYTGYLHYSLSEGKYHFFRRSAGDDNGTAISFSYNETEEALLSTLNKTQTVQARLKTTGSSYSDASFASWPGTVSVERTYMSSATATSSPSATNMTAATTDAVLTSSITLTASANSGYYFEGWGDASDSNPTDGTAAKTYTITDTKTSYAFFSQAYTLTYAPKGDYSTSTVSVYSVDDYSGATTSGSAIPTGHMITLVATPATGYEVEGWYSDASCETAYTNGSGGVTIENGNNTFKLASLNTNSAVYPKFRPKTYTIKLANMEATEAGTTSVTLTYDASTNMTSPIIKPTKTNYTFDGYWVRNESTHALETQLIDANGNWIKYVAGYTSNDGAGNPTWVHDYAISLYAKWNETPRTITLNVSPAGAGTVSPVGPVTAYIVTPSATITATPNPGWVFKKWQYGTNVGPYTGTGTNNTVQVTASVNGTLTAVFEPRYYLVGGEITSEGDGGSGTSSGMPGWDSYTKPFNVITSSPILATCSLTLGTNKNFYIMVRDKTDGLSYGKSGGISLGDDASVKFENQDNKVLFYSNGGTNYTFKITAVDVNGRPTVSVERPHQMHFAHKRVDIDGNDHIDNLGGRLTATINDESAIDEQWFDYGSDVSWTATAETGYSLTWYTDNAYSNAMNPQPSASWSDPDITHDENIYAKFTENATTVTINTNNTRGGSITVGGSAFTWGSTKTAGVTTKRALVVTPNTGYNFSGWTLSSTPDFELQDKDPETDTDVTLAGRGGTHGSTGTLTANFSAKTYTVTLENDHGESTDNGSATATYDATSLSSITHAQFDGWTLLGYWNSSAQQVANADGSLISGVSDYTNASSDWIYDNNVSLYAHWDRTVTLDKNGGSADGSVVVNYKGGANTPFSAPTRTGYHVEGYYTESSCEHKVMNADGSLVNYGEFIVENKWKNKTVDKLYANWVPDTYTVTLHNDHAGASSDDGTAIATYDATSLSSITHAQFDGWTLLGYWNSSAQQVTDANGTLISSVTDYTDGSGKWTKTENAELWAHWSRTVTLDRELGTTGAESMTVTYKLGTLGGYSAPTRVGCTFGGYYTGDNGTGTQVINTSGTFQDNVDGYTDGSAQWIKHDATTLYAKWTSDNFVIYRTGDMAEDPRALSGDVESYAGGTISEVIEYRMKVHTLDHWYTLCLPFTVNAVKVWDDADNLYYDIVPYYRTGEGLYSGHYFIRTPSSTTNFPIANFDDWHDPTRADYLPAKNTPYIIQWHDPYFLNKYISFFGDTGQEIPNAMTIGVAPDENNVVNVYGNNAMVSGSVPGAYMLEPDYGSDGAWLRLDDASESRTIPPFECFIRASEPVTRNYVAIRRGMSLNDLSTGETVIADNQIAPLIRVYTLSGIMVTQFTDCSFSQVAYMLSIDRPAGIYILCSDKEAVKVIVGGK